MAAFLGQGATISWNGNPIGQVLSIDGPNMERAMIDTTNLATSSTVDSVSVKFRTFAAGFGDAGEVSVEVQFDHDDTAQGAMWDDFTAGTSRHVIITFSDSDSYTFTAFVRSMSHSQAIDEVNRATIAFKITGAVDHTTG